MKRALLNELHRAFDDDIALDRASSPDSFAVPYGTLRSIGFSLTALAVILFHDSEQNLGLAVILLLAAMVQPLMALTGEQNRDVKQTLLDLTIMTALTAIDPTLWHAGNLLALASVAWLGIRLPIRRYLTICLLAIVILAVAGAIADAPSWPAVVSISAIALLLLGWKGLELRRTLAEYRVSLQEVLAISGSILHYSRMDDQTNSWALGPIEELTGWTMEEWSQMNHEELLHPDSSEYWLDAAVAKVGQIVKRTGGIRCKDGSYRWVRDNSKVVQTNDGHLAVRGFFFDITEIEEANSFIRKQASLDQLTGLPNRFALENDLLALQQHGTTHAVLILDVNRFKEINDTLGHTSGDAVLRALAERLSGLSRAGDLVCRLGGDEFAIVLRSIHSEQDAVVVAQRMGDHCNRPYELGELTVVAPVSIGIAIVSTDPKEMTDADHRSQIADTLRKADLAMYEAKRSGVECVVFSDDLEQVSVEQLSLTAAIGTALDRDEFVLYFQPKIDLLTNEVVGVEGLARWEHPTRGTLTPAAFLDLVVLSNSYQRFTDRIIDQGAEFVARARAAGYELPVAVNISVRSLHDPEFVHRFRQAVHRHRIAPENLVLEVTEQDLHRESSGSITALHELVSIGVEISIDDFGTGYSSLQRLRELQVHELKIDRTFVSAIQKSPQDQVIAQTIVGLADRLNLRVVAEGVEHPDERDLLISMGCQIAQGYLFARPLPAEELLDQLSGSNSSFTGRRLVGDDRP